MKIITPYGCGTGAFEMILENEHRLYFSRYRLVAYLGPLGPRLFTPYGVHRLHRTARQHLNQMLPMRYQEFKPVADIRPDTVIPEFMRGVYFEIAKAAVLGRVLT